MLLRPLLTDLFFVPGFIYDSWRVAKFVPLALSGSD
jgi:hypothetical protein